MTGRLFHALALLALIAPGGAMAESLIANRSILAKTLIGPGDFRLAAAEIPGAVSDPKEVIGKEALVTIYQGRPIRPGDLGPPALVDRNDIVRIHFLSGPLDIATDGRALDRGAMGERVRVMNLASRTVVTGAVTGSGSVSVTR